ncbi:MAG: hypothetical protein K2N22_01760 [Clostridia bacterium]|nr:hypothetical protein [Clostridia bacterium]
MKNECCRCAYFTAYYTKAYCCFLRTDCGHCDEQNQTVKKRGSCESFKPKSHPRKIKRALVLDELEKALTTINGIKLILDEREEEFKIIRD